MFSLRLRKKSPVLLYRPHPEGVLKLLGLRPIGLNNQGYLVLHCPVHKEGKEKHPSLNIDRFDGHYRCHACGIKGSNITDFYSVVTGKSFAVAVDELFSKRSLL